MVATITAVARELRAARENLGYTREQLAEKINYSAGYIEKIETGKLPVTEGYIAAATTVLAPGVDAGDLFSRLREDERKEAVPRWFKPWRDIESEATALRLFNPLVVPGLLQTEEYARAQLQTSSEEVTQQRVATRLERQRRVFRKDAPPDVVVTLDEAVLHRQLGEAKLMHDQLVALTCGSSVVQIVPHGAFTCLNLDGPFEIATIDGAEVAYAETPLRGFVLDSREVVSEARQRWEVLRAEALPVRQSTDLILEVAKRWVS